MQITYEVLGQVDGLKWTPKLGKEDVFFEVLKRKERWKITRPQLIPHLFVPAAIKALEAIKDPTVKTALRELHALE